MITQRAQELVDSIEELTFRDMVEEARASLPPTKTNRARYMRAYQGITP